MPDLDIRNEGNGPKWSAVWLDGEAGIVKGFNAWLKVGDRQELDRVLYHLI